LPPATSDTVTLSWTAPSENTNGTALTNLAGYQIYYGTSASALTQQISINTVGVMNYVVSNLSSGTWYFEIVAVNSAGEQSTPSSVVSTTI
jgi:Tfp pilus assembly protein PilX